MVRELKKALVRFYIEQAWKDYSSTGTRKSLDVFVTDARRSWQDYPVGALKSI
jgi:hypothetical protein